MCSSCIFPDFCHLGALMLVFLHDTFEDFWRKLSVLFSSWPQGPGLAPYWAVQERWSDSTGISARHCLLWDLHSHGCFGANKQDGANHSGTRPTHQCCLVVQCAVWDEDQCIGNCLRFSINFTRKPNTVSNFLWVPYLLCTHQHVFLLQFSFYNRSSFELFSQYFHCIFEGNAHLSCVNFFKFPSLQAAAETAYDMVSPVPDERDTKRVKRYSHYGPAHQPVDLREGVAKAYTVVKEVCK